MNLIKNTEWQMPEKFAKHSAAIYVKGKLNLRHRQAYNILLAYAQKNGFAQGDIYEMSLKLMLEELGYTSNNRKHFIKLLTELAEIPVTFNAFGNDRKNQEKWRGFTRLLADIAFSNTNHIRYSFPPQLNELLKNPSIYAYINISVQNNFNTKYSLPLYEIFSELIKSSGSGSYTLNLNRLKDFFVLPQATKNIKSSIEQSSNRA
nr:replication initiation protein [Methylomarinum sp. Ch1-1]MDP4523225.1 replication initiation protein [Methylomarinum sp. Ch1-1]